MPRGLYHKAKGYSDDRPVITDVDTDETIGGTQTDVVITGTGFGASAGSVALINNPRPRWAVSVSQSIDTWADTSIQFDANIVGLS